MTTLHDTLRRSWLVSHSPVFYGWVVWLVATAMVPGTALGPLIFGWSYDNLGGYSPPLYLGIGLAVIAFVGR